MNSTETTNILSLENICRCCLTESLDLKSIFNENLIQQKLLLISKNLILNQNDGLPELICDNCILLLNSAYNFQQQIEKSENILKQLLENINNSSESPEETVLLNEENWISFEIEEPVDETLQEVKQIKKNTKERNHMCTICGSQFYDANVLRNHVRIHTNERPFNCEICGVFFKQKSHLTTHSKIHSSKEHFCDVCDKGFTLPWQLKIHKRIHDQQKPYKCPDCLKSFSQSGNLKIHMRIHNNEKPFVCDCGKGYPNKSELLVHMRQHSGEKLAKTIDCPNCDKKFVNKTEMKVHVRIVHSGEKPFACNQCPKTFAMNSHLVVHARSHTGEKPYNCLLCEKSFASSSILKTHSYVHTGEKNYECEFCHKKLSQPSSRSVHRKTHFKNKNQIFQII